MDNGRLAFASTTNIAASGTFVFGFPIEYLNRYKRTTVRFMSRYEDDLNTAGGTLSFQPLATAAGGVAWATLAFPLGADVGAYRTATIAANLVPPSYSDVIQIANADAAKAIDQWELVIDGVDEQ